MKTMVSFVFVLKFKVGVWVGDMRKGMGRGMGRGMCRPLSIVNEV